MEQQDFQQFKIDGDNKFRARDWNGACDAYDKYYSQKYPNPDQMNDDDSILLVKYAEALINLFNEQKNNHQTPDPEDLDTASKYLLTARVAMDKMESDAYPIYSYIDTYGLLANVYLASEQFERAAQENLEGYNVACSKANCSWRDKLSLLFSAGIATEASGKYNEAIDLINRCIAFVDEEKSKEHSEEDIALLDDFRQNFENKLDQLNELKKALPSN